MIPLQAKSIAAPQPVNATDVMGIVNQVMSIVSSAMPKVIAVAYFILVLMLLWRMWKAKGNLPNMELIGLGILFGLMR